MDKMIKGQRKGMQVELHFASQTMNGKSSSPDSKYIIPYFKPNYEQMTFSGLDFEILPAMEIHTSLGECLEDL